MSKQINDNNTIADDFFIFKNQMKKKDAQTIVEERIEYLKKKLGKK